MLLTVGDFKSRVGSGLDSLVVELQDLTGRTGKEEAEAWRSSLPATAALLSSPGLDPFHIFFGGSGNLALEYQLPAASAWCDVVLLGSKAGRPSALVMELKHWATVTDEPGSIEGLVLRSGTPRLHPSRQVGNYTEYIRRFHSAVVETSATVNGCVFFTRTGQVGCYDQAPNHLLAANYPMFTTQRQDVDERFPKFASGLLNEPSEAFAQAFEKGRYRQDRGFVKQIGQQILDPASSPFVLIDKQDQAFLQCRERVRRVVDSRDGSNRKHVVIVHGPPGSGKSVVAARLWASLVTDPSVQAGDMVLTTTSASQNSNWVHLVNASTHLGGAGGIVKKATGYHPVSTQKVGQLRARHGRDLFVDATAWRENVSLLRKLTEFQPGAEDDAYLVSLVDEAHALINPEHKSGRGQFGFAPTLGPQAFHIIRASRLSAFFMDRDQGYRDRENTRVEDILVWAAELGASVDQIDLSGAQFRCAGSKEYADWIEVIRSNTHPQIAGRYAQRWRARPMAQLIVRRAVGESVAPTYAASGMEFHIAPTPAALEAWLRDRILGGFSARILASYCRKWITQETTAPHALPANMQDFQIPYVDPSGKRQVWARPWNFVPAQSGDYTLYVQAPPGSAMARDPLCEVGCPYAVRGFDFDYVGLIWGLDLVWRKERWIAQPDHVHETGIRATTTRARHDPTRENQDELSKRLWQTYRILMTRAMRGAVLFVEDEETREYLVQAAAQKG